jgi:hypothetical protein
MTTGDRMRGAEVLEQACEFRISVCLTHPGGQIMSDGKGGYRAVCTVIEPPPDLALTRSVPVNDYERLLRIEAVMKVVADQVEAASYHRNYRSACVEISRALRAALDGPEGREGV